MPTIKVRKQANGNTRYTAIVRIRRGGAILYRESRTFAHRSAALSWAKHREVVLEDPSALTRVQHGAPTLAELIRWYIDTFETISKWQRSKQAHLEVLERHALGKCNALTLTSAALIDHVRSRRAKGAGPATVANDLIWTGVVLRAAKSVRELPVRPEIVQEARNACAELRLIGKARKRARRPTPRELEQLRDYFARRDKRSQIPMLAIMEFSLASARRESEICRLEWCDNDERTRTGIVRDAKHPTRKEGNHRQFKYTPEAWAIAQTQARMTIRGASVRPSRARAMSWALRTFASTTCGTKPPVACSNAAIRSTRSHNSRSTTRGTSSSATRISSPRMSASSCRRQRRTLRTILAGRSWCLRQLRPASVDQLGEIGRTDEPGRLLSAEPEDATRQHLCGCAPASLFITQTEISAIHNIGLLW
jgi:integrase